MVRKGKWKDQSVGVALSSSGSATPVPDTAGPRPKRRAKPNPRVTDPEWEM